jgi:hypothetical protein
VLLAVEIVALAQRIEPVLRPLDTERENEIAEVEMKWEFEYFLEANAFL